MATETYDAIIVGSGAGGGMSAYHLTRSGMKVLMLEAGRDYDPRVETPMSHMNSSSRAFSPWRLCGVPASVPIAILPPAL